MAIELPIKYYLDYYRYITAYVLRHYEEMLHLEELDFIESSQLMDEAAFCLYLRMANRRGLFFRPSQLNYEEVPDLEESLAILVKNNFIEPLGKKHKTFAYDWLLSYKKADLWDVYKTIYPTDKTLKKAGVKEALLLFLLEQTPFDDLLNNLVKKEAVYVQGRQKEEQLVRFLFFGNLYSGTTDFVVRDVGHRSFEKKDDDDFVPIFSSRQEVDECWVLSIASQQWHLVAKIITPAIALSWLNRWFNPTHQWTKKGQQKLDKLILKVGKYLEQKKMPEEALHFYKNTKKSPSRERQARILVKLDKKEEAVALCQIILLDAKNATESIFAKDFIARLTTTDRLKSTRKKLKEADSIQLDQSWQYQVERGVLQHYMNKGYEGLHAENSVWRAMFGIVFWNLLFDGESAAFHHPLQYAPSDLRLPDFYENRKDQIDECLKILTKKENFEKHLAVLFEEKWGIHNPFIYWDFGTMEIARTLYKFVKPKPLKAVLLQMTKNVKENTKGFPDLFVWKKRAYWFVEVKSPTDMLSEQQLFWQNFFEEHKIKTMVLKVEWK